MVKTLVWNLAYGYGLNDLLVGELMVSAGLRRLSSARWVEGEVGPGAVKEKREADIESASRERFNAG